MNLATDYHFFDVPYIARLPLASGLLVGKFTRDTRFELLLGEFLHLLLRWFSLLIRDLNDRSGRVGDDRAV